jgi:hypothetical protein
MIGHAQHLAPAPHAPVRPVSWGCLIGRSRICLLREKKTDAARATSGDGGVRYPLGNRPLPQVVIGSLDQVSWLPSFLLARLPMGLPQWRREHSYSVQLREQRPNGTSLFQRGWVQKQFKWPFYTEDHACQDRLPKSVAGEARLGSDVHPQVYRAGVPGSKRKHLWTEHGAQ